MFLISFLNFIIMIKEYFYSINIVSTLGFNIYYNVNELGFWGARYKKFIGFHVNSTNILINSYYTKLNLKCITKLVGDFLLMDSVFFFITLSKEIFSVTPVYKFLQNKIYSYFVYDWIFGVVSNYKLIFKTYRLRRQPLVREKPDIALVIQTKKWTSPILNELKFRNTFSIGVVRPNHIKSVDYPLPVTDSYEAGHFIITYFLKQFTFTMTDNLFISRSDYLCSIKQ